MILKYMFRQFFLTSQFNHFRIWKWNSEKVKWFKSKKKLNLRCQTKYWNMSKMSKSKMLCRLTILKYPLLSWCYYLFPQNPGLQQTGDSSSWYILSFQVIRSVSNSSWSFRQLTAADLDWFPIFPNNFVAFCLKMKLNSK